MGVGSRRGDRRDEGDRGKSPVIGEKGTCVVFQCKWWKSASLLVASLLLITLVAVVGCGEGSDTTTTSVTENQTGSSDGSGTGSGESKKILVACAQYGSSATKEVSDLFKAKAEAAGYEVEIRDVAGDYDKLVGIFENAVNEKFDVIVNSMSDINQLTTAYETVFTAGIPIIGLDCQPDEKQTLNIQSDNTKIGELMAENLAAAIGGKGNVVEFIHDGHPAVYERMRGLENIFATKYPDIKIISVHAITFPSPAQDCRDAMANYLTANPEVGSIAGAAFGFDDAANGGVEAILAAGRNEIKVVSCDATAQTLDALTKNDPNSPWLGTVAQDWDAISTKCLEACEAIFAGNPPAYGSNEKTEPLWVNSENAADFVK